MKKNCKEIVFTFDDFCKKILKPAAKKLLKEIEAREVFQKKIKDYTSAKVGTKLRIKLPNDFNL